MWEKEQNKLVQRVVDPNKCETPLVPGMQHYPDGAARISGANKYFGQGNQDEMVEKLTDKKNNGFYIDLAANHYKLISNTYLLDVNYNWKGLCMEPNRGYLLELTTYRNCTVVVSPVSSESNHTITFRMGEEFGGIVGDGMDNKGKPRNQQHDVELVSVSMNDVLAQFPPPEKKIVHKAALREMKPFNADIIERAIDKDDENAVEIELIDYFSFDIEGAEYLALRSLNFDKYVFSIVSLERPTETLHKLLTAHGYW